MVSRSFSPSQWYEREWDEGEQPTNGDIAMWVYREITPGTWTVGFYSPSGEWHADGIFATKEKAAARVNYLNGGRTSNEDRQP